MCTVSMVMDHYWDKWQPYQPSNPFVPIGVVPLPAISKEEIEEFRRLLERAREYDKRNNEPDCELAQKRERVKRLAEELGVKIDFL
jgi:hypothetical protein